MTSHDDGPDLRATVATACRVLARHGLVNGVLGHVSARVSRTELVVRCRGEEERGLAASVPEDIWRVSMEGQPIDLPAGYSPPHELPIHTEVLRARPEVGAVVHAHPEAALLCGLAEFPIRPVFGAYNIPAFRLALDGVPVFERPILITRRELAEEMLDAMGDASVCLLRGHGITVAAETVEQATVIALDFNALLGVTVELARLGASPPPVSPGDAEELPDLGRAFTTRFAWQALIADLEAHEARGRR